MLTTCCSKELSKTLNLFNVPMFAAQRESTGEPFRLISINRAHEEAAGLRAGDVEGAHLPDILPRHEAEAVAARYADCAHSGCDQRYIETLTLPAGLTRWDTSLQHVRMESGGDRIIGTSFRMDLTPEKAAFDDVLYLTALADMQLQNMVSLLEAAEQQAAILESGSLQKARLAALCRSAQQAVADAKNKAMCAKAIKRHEPDKLVADTGETTSFPGARTIQSMNEVLID